MFKFLERWLAYLFIPAGIVLLFLPLNSHRTEEVEREVVFLIISESLGREISANKNVALPSPPEMPTEENVLHYIQGLQKVVSREGSSIATPINTYGYPVIRKQELAPYPALLEAKDNLMRQGAHWNQKRIYSQRLNDVQFEDWDVFKGIFLGNSDISDFQYGDQIFKERIQSEYISLQVEIENLNIAHKVAGSIFLFIGLMVWRGMYGAPSKGIQIGKRFGMILWDGIVVGLGVLFAWALLDSLLAKYLQTSSVLGDVQLGLFLGAFWVTFGNLVMALFVTATGTRTLLITEKSVSVTGLLGKRSLDWAGVEDIRLAELYSARRVCHFTYYGTTFLFNKKRNSQHVN